jgi:peroxiredoxin
MPRFFLACPPILLLLLTLGSNSLEAASRYYPRAPQLRIQEWLQENPVELKQLRGKVVMLEFFQIVCPPCEVARPEIESLQARFSSQGLQVLGIAVAFQDLENQTAEKIRAYMKKHPAPYPVGIDEALEAPDGELPELRTSFDIYGADASPYVVVIDRQGRIRGSGVYETEEVESFLREVLAEPSR